MPAPAVGHENDDVALLQLSLDFDVRLGVFFGHAIFQGVVHQIAQGLRQQLAVGQDIQSGNRLHIQGSAILFGDGLIEFGHAFNNLAGIDGLQHFPGLAGFGAGNGEKRIEGLQQAVRFLDGLVQGGAVFGLAVGAQGGFNPGPQPRERRFQVVGHIAADFLHAGHQAFDLVEHFIEGTGQLVQFIAGSRQPACGLKDCRP